MLSEECEGCSRCGGECAMAVHGLLLSRYSCGFRARKIMLCRFVKESRDNIILFAWCFSAHSVTRNFADESSVPLWRIKSRRMNGLCGACTNQRNFVDESSLCYRIV